MFKISLKLDRENLKYIIYNCIIRSYIALYLIILNLFVILQTEVKAGNLWFCFLRSAEAVSGSGIQCIPHGNMNLNRNHDYRTGSQRIKCHVNHPVTKTTCSNLTGIMKTVVWVTNESSK